MSDCNCSRTGKCTAVAVIASIIIGVITTVLRIFAVITVTPVFLWILFGVAVISLLAALIAAPLIRTTGIRGCVCKILPLLFLGILGTVLTAVILLVTSAAESIIIGAIITGLLFLFFSLILTSSVCLIRCTVGCGGNNSTLL